MAQRIFVELAVDVADGVELLEVLSGMQVSISGDDVIGWELAHVCDDNSPIVSNFLK
jgi:hypothetical protein